jgi:vacuolar-type H+-ATPase subunit F/Vma7
MSYAVRVVCPPEVAAGFALAGLHSSSVGTLAEGNECVKELLSRPDVGVILLEERLHAALSNDIRRELARRPLPIVVPFPGPSWVPRAEGPDSYILELLRQAIGYRVRLR